MTFGVKKRSWFRHQIETTQGYLYFKRLNFSVKAKIQHRLRFDQLPDKILPLIGTFLDGGCRSELAAELRQSKLSCSFKALVNDFISVGQNCLNFMRKSQKMKDMSCIRWLMTLR